MTNVETLKAAVTSRERASRGEVRALAHSREGLCRLLATSAGSLAGESTGEQAAALQAIADKFAAAELAYRGCESRELATLVPSFADAERLFADAYGLVAALP